MFLRFSLVIILYMTVFLFQIPLGALSFVRQQYPLLQNYRKIKQLAQNLIPKSFVKKRQQMHWKGLFDEIEERYLKA